MQNAKRSLDFVFISAYFSLIFFDFAFRSVPLCVLVSALVLFPVRAYNGFMKRTILLDGQTVEYTLERKRVKNINLRVRGGEVFVSAARWVPIAVIERFLQSRADFILGAMERTEKPAAPVWADGAPVPYRGKSLRLVLSAGRRSAAELADGELRLTLPRPEDPESVRRAVEKWTRGESERLCRACCDRLCPLLRRYGVPDPEIRVRTMRSLWGNCRPERGIVTFNARLAAVPDACLEYVVAHELCHFLHADHSPAFYAALARLVPDWKARRTELKSWASIL